MGSQNERSIFIISLSLSDSFLTKIVSQCTKMIYNNKGNLSEISLNKGNVFFVLLFAFSQGREDYI